jgi:hypothetical protein
LVELEVIFREKEKRIGRYAICNLKCATVGDMILQGTRP